jgi:hypothetical protein
LYVFFGVAFLQLHLKLKCNPFAIPNAAFGFDAIIARVSTDAALTNVLKAIGWTAWIVALIVPEAVSLRCLNRPLSSGDFHPSFFSSFGNIPFALPFCFLTLEMIGSHRWFI